MNRQVELVWDHYCSQQKPCGRRYHPNRPPPEKIERLIQRQLKRFTVDDLRHAIDVLHTSDFHTGNNDRGQRYLRIGLAIDDDHILERLDQHEQSLHDRQDAERRDRLRAVIEQNNTEAKTEDENYHAARLAKGLTTAEMVKNKTRQ